MDGSREGKDKGGSMEGKSRGGSVGGGQGVNP